ncbi:MAG: riboflavin biosynthesis protein RibF [Coriobacteriales bacterium]|jgi:riboflavin kinase/FMN adenylyltransferase
MTGEQAQALARSAFLRQVAPAIGGAATGDAPTELSAVVRLDPEPGLYRPVEPAIGDAVCALGAFDGIHRGHRFLFAQTVGDARAHGVRSAIVTFDPDPDEIFKPVARQRKILSNADRIEYLRRFGADAVVVVPFTPELAANTARDFVDDVLARALRPVSIHVGADFRLGAGNEGTVESLRSLGATRGFDVFGHDLRMSGDAPVSATRIRDLLQQGRIDEVNDLLCRPHFVTGSVGPGRHQGATFGFPTANILVTYPYVLPLEGVYAGFVRVGDTAWPAAINVGSPKTFDGVAQPRLLEANLVGFEGDLYGSEVSVAFVRRLRGQRKFDTIEELIAVVERNIGWVSDNLGSGGIRL